MNFILLKNILSLFPFKDPETNLMEGKTTTGIIQLAVGETLQSDNADQMESNAEDSGKLPTTEMEDGSCTDLPGKEGECIPLLTEEQADDYTASEEADGNQTISTELTANSRRKTIIHKKRLSAMGITKADDDQILSQEMFVSIANNQFKWNGKGSFGTFLF